MRTLRVALHGLALGLATILSIMAGYAVYRASGLSEQVVIQVLAAGIVCTFSFALWGKVVHVASSGRLTLKSLPELGVSYLLGFVWSAVVFVPFHYMTQGYVTTWDNILAMWLFQVPFNLLALMVANGRLLTNESAGS